MLMKKGIVIILLAALLAGIVSAAPAEDMRDTAVAYMEVKYKCGCTRNGTGTMVAPNGLITAGHNLCCEEHGKGAKSIKFQFGRKSNGKSFYTYSGQYTAYWYGSYRENGYDSRYDIGFVVFPKDIGNRTGFYASNALSDEDLKWEFTHMIGYKKGKPTSDWNQIEVHDQYRVTWTMSPEFQGGNEGGPLYFEDDAEEFPILIAVYTSFNGSTGYARRLTTALFRDMREAGVHFK